jgi:hypothetical protein
MTWNKSMLVENFPFILSHCLQCHNIPKYCGYKYEDKLYHHIYCNKNICKNNISAKINLDIVIRIQQIYLAAS